MDDNIKDQETKNTYTDLSEKDSEDSVPLNFDYYNKKDTSSTKKALAIAAISLCAIIAAAAGLHSLDNRKSDTVSDSVSSHYDSYPGSPYADDTDIRVKGVTDNGLGYTIYDSHARITSFDNVLMPVDLTVPATINGVPVTEIDYFVFSFCQLRSLYISNPDCIFFDSSDDLPPVPVETTLVGKEGSDAQKMAEKYGNKFIAR